MPQYLLLQYRFTILLVIVTCFTANNTLFSQAFSGINDLAYGRDNEVKFNNKVTKNTKQNTNNHFQEQENNQHTPTSFIFAVQTFNTICGYREGGIAIKALGGTAPYRYAIDTTLSWDTGNNIFFSSLYAGIYKVFAKDALGVLDSISVTITNTYNAPSLSAPYYLVTSPGCRNTLPAITLTASGGQPPYLYSTDIINYQSSPTFNNLYRGNYYWSVKDANGCIKSIQGDIDASACTFAFSLSITGLFCGNNGYIHVSAYQATPPYQYSLDDSIHFQSEGLFNNLSPGQHKVFARDATGLLTVYVVTTRENCTLITNVTATPATCSMNNGSINISASNGIPPYQYSIDGFVFQLSNTFSGLAEGTYPIIVRDSVGKVTYSSAIVSDGCPSVTATSVPTNCGLNNGNITASGSNGKMPYLYSLNGIDFQQGSQFSGLRAGNYTVTLRDSLGFKDSIVVNVSNGNCFSVSASHSNAICGETGSITATAINGTAPIRYSLNGINYHTSNIFSGLPAGSYFVYAKNSNQVIDSVAVVINGSILPKFSLGKDTIVCRGNPPQLYPDSTFSNVNYLWNTGAVARTIIANSAGEYWLKITNTDGCIWIDTVDISFKTLPNFNLGNDTSICEKDSVTLDATVIGATNYLWSNGIRTSQIKASQQNIYWCDVTKDGCVYRDSLRLIIKPLPAVYLGADTILCESATLVLNAFNTSATYQWQDNSANSTYTVLKEGIYSITVNKNNCTVTDTINVFYSLKPRFTLGTDQLICQGQTIILQPNINAQWHLQWQNGSSLPTYKVTQPGGYYLDATNTCGTTRDDIAITSGLCMVYVPNAFTPNGDTKNDVFKVSGTDLVMEFHLQIFNRFGQLVFETSDKNKGWDGNLKGQPSAAGAYVYMLQYSDTQTSQMQFIRGSFLLIR